MNEFIKRLEEHENGSSTLETRELSWYNGFVHATEATGELALKKELEGYYQEHTEKKSSRVIQIWSAIGIAAMLAVGGFYFSTVGSSTGPIQLKTNEAPIYGDSASYDSTENKLEKKSEKDVDN